MLYGRTKRENGPYKEAEVTDWFGLDGTIDSLPRVPDLLFLGGKFGACNKCIKLFLPLRLE